ncbi:hypothetical protein ACLIMP_12495 [Novosphingobium aerophilum]|uniref:hypothetical protein n=1 Tax=Novosphingobium TaxID=165696 RepID=UPI0012C3FF97|nr:MULTISPECIES: hypothetical protein [unclassified Novosphingobium]MPS69616.1 hypothetical protein [Novosphingobium sp.]WRT92083.1 hypothetical protein U9J33_12810 [Novosphingobium sp. RL4]
MSFSDSGTSLKQHLGCIGGGLLGSAFVVTLLGGAAMGDCGRPGSAECKNDGLIKFLMFPGSLIVLILVGLFAAWRMTKDRD